MTDAKKAELAKLQQQALNAAAELDAHEHRRFMELILYWIRREIHAEVQHTLLKFDPVKANAFSASAVHMTESVRDAFGKQQAALFKVFAEGDSESLGRQFFVFCDWVDILIQHNINAYTQPYIKVSVKQINGHGREGKIGTAKK
jgi:hypothetical protein